MTANATQRTDPPRIHINTSILIGVSNQKAPVHTGLPWVPPPNGNTRYSVRDGLMPTDILFIVPDSRSTARYFPERKMISL